MRGVETLPGPVRRALAVGLAVLALGLAVLMAVAPFALMAAVGEEIDAAADQIAQQELLLRAAARRPKLAQRDLLLAGETSGMAGAELQRVISDLARQNSLSLRSAHVTPPKREAELTVLGVEVSLHGHVEGLRAFLHAIETGVPVLFVETLSIRTIAPHQPVQQPVSLDIILRVRGYGAAKEVN